MAPWAANGVANGFLRRSGGVECAIGRSPVAGCQLGEHQQLFALGHQLVMQTFLNTRKQGEALFERMNVV